MKSNTAFALVSLITLPALLGPRAAGAQDAPPPGMAAVEVARSQGCVGTTARLADLNAIAAPYVRRAQRLQALAQAVALEDSAGVAPLDTLDAVEREVHTWFQSDHALALRIVAGDSTLVAERDLAREGVKKHLQDAMDAVTAEAQAKLKDADQVQAAAQRCQNAIFVRPTVLDACKTTPGSPLCAPAKVKPDTTRQSPAQSQFRFVDAPEDLWDIEELRPWSQPGPLQAAPGVGLSGARTAARARRGNIIVAVALAPMIRPRAQLDSTQIAEFQANLDSLGFTFDHPDFVMAPALEIQASVPAPVGGETVYLLHFGDLATPDIVWSVPADKGGVIQATFPAKASILEKLEAGETLSFTAVKVPEGTTEGTPVYTLSLLNVNESASVTALLAYMKSGDLGNDLKAMIPPAGGTGSGS